MAALPRDLIENPEPARPPEAASDVLSDVLRAVRVTGALQFCFMPRGAWQTDAAPSLACMAEGAATAMPFHIVVEGACWLKMAGGEETVLETGDVVAFPFGTGHQLGAGAGGLLVEPLADLPPRPWRDLPVLRYGAAGPPVRLVCGFLQCDAMIFRPLREALPPMLHARTAGVRDAAWLRAVIEQIAAEVDRPRPGGLSILERLTEMIFIELLRHQIARTAADSAGWLSALSDPALARCLGLIHRDPAREWSLRELAAGAGLSRSALAERFEALLATSPIRYLREWRLYLASVELTTTGATLAAIAEGAGYGTEAAFNRAFSRAYGAPPATWRAGRRAPPATPAVSLEG